MDGEVEGPFTVPSEWLAVIHNIYYSESEWSRDGELAEVRGVRDGLTPGGKVGGFNEIISRKHFDLPEAPCCTSCSGTMRPGEIVFLSRNARVQECETEQWRRKTCSLSSFPRQHQGWNQPLQQAQTNASLPIWGLGSRHSGWHVMASFTRKESLLPAASQMPSSYQTDWQGSWDSSQLWSWPFLSSPACVPRPHLIQIASCDRGKEGQLPEFQISD